MKRSSIWIFFLLAALLPSSCTKMLDAGTPQTSLVGTAVFSNAGSATAALLNVYTQMENSLPNDITVSLGQSSDELVSYSSPLSGFYTNTVTALNGPDPCWGISYTILYGINRVIAGVSSSGIDSAVKSQLLGEAYFLRAYQYFYLVNLYGDVPYTTTADYTVNTSLSRTPAIQVYANIVSDLKMAQSLLSNTYVTTSNQPGGQRTRANLGTATALLARVYLYMGDWADAATQASAVISNPVYYLEPNLNNVFLINSNEAIWQLAPALIQTSTNGPLGLVFILTTPPASAYNGYVALGNPVWNSFDAGDQRKTSWVGTYTDNTGTWYYPYKYKVDVSGAPSTEYTVVLRLAEQYLIRAEALARQNQFGAAVQDINTLRQRAGAPLLPAIPDLADCLTAIAKERQSELFTEWADRWFDLKRTGQLTPVLSQIAAKSWTATDTLFPIPQGQMQYDPNMTQNPGY